MFSSHVLDTDGNVFTSNGFTQIPSRPKLGYLKHDYEFRGMSRPTYKGDPPRILGLPETIKTLYSQSVPITEAWQWYWMDLFALSLYRKLYNACNDGEKAVLKVGFRSTTKGDRAFTNKTGWDDGYCDFVNRVNMGATPMRQETITCGGNVVELLSNVEMRAGVQVYKVRTLNMNNRPPNPLEVNLTRTPWLIFKAIISRRNGYNESTRTWAREDMAIPFDQLQTRDVPIPFASNIDFDYIRADRIVPLDDTTPIPESYVY